MIIPKEILTQHVAVLGKTGSGKTSTAKFLIEQVVAEGARVCVLDPIKSDWWGLTSSRDGKKAGLPFHILGGPRGHVPLHASAGKVIGEIVANGALPLSIIDMADFEPGGQAKFFTEFAPTLLRKMRGVVYLVIEEAHLFAPKERSGIGAENLSIHWAKTLATAGRSKGVRLVLVTQRTQALHNALLGSCDTMIAHRLTAPADQEPVVKWLKANTSKEVLEQVSSSLASLKTGDAWLCSGEAKRFEILNFPRIHTYDNTATPTGDGDTREIKTAPVDQEKLRAIIGAEIEKAKADDPRELRKQIAELTRQLSAKAPAAVPPPKPTIVELPVLKDAQIARLEKVYERMLAKADDYGKAFTILWQQQSDEAKALLDVLRVVANVPKVAATVHQMPHRQAERTTPAQHQVRQAGAASPGGSRVRARPAGGDGDASIGDSGLRRMLVALAQRNGLTSRQLAIRTGMAASGGSFRTYLSRGRTNGWIAGDRQRIEITEAGITALGSYDPLPEGADLQAHWLRELGNSGAAAMLRALCEAYPNGLSKEALGQATNMETSGGSFRTYLSRLRTLELIVGKTELRASDELFS